MKFVRKSSKGLWDRFLKDPYGVDYGDPTKGVLKEFWVENKPIVSTTKKTSEVLDQFIKATKDLKIKEPKVKEGKTHIKIKKPSAPKGVKAEITGSKGGRFSSPTA